MRSHLSERGLTSRRGKSALYALIESVITPDEDGVIGTSREICGLFVSMLAKEYQNLRNLDQEGGGLRHSDQGPGEPFAAHASGDGDSRIRTDCGEQFCGSTR